MHGNTRKGMTFSLQSQSYLRLIQASGMVAAVWLAGCDGSKPQSSGAGSGPPPTPASSEALSNEHPGRDAVPAVAPATPQPRSTENAAPSDPAALAKEFRATTEPDRRGELVDTLWSLDTAAAVETIRQLFLTEREIDVKMDMIAGLSDSKKPETREARFGLVVAALTPGQPKDIRELAAQMLIDFDDPRAVGLLQQFSQDADPDMREAAKEALETRRAVEQP
jgi:hypothetical protein